MRGKGQDNEEKLAKNSKSEVRSLKGMKSGKLIDPDNGEWNAYVWTLTLFTGTVKLVECLQKVQS